MLTRAGRVWSLAEPGAGRGGDEREHLVEAADLDRPVGRRLRGDERQLEAVAPRALIERHQQTQTGRVDEGDAAQIERHLPRAVDVVQRGIQRRGGGKVELPTRLDERGIVASLDLDGERLADAYRG
jgi:hypothetical protein